MLPALSIAPDDGVIRIQGLDQVIRPGLAKAVAMAAFAALYRAHIDYRNGYEWLAFHRVGFGGRPCGFSLCFHLGLLEQLHFGVSILGMKSPQGWPDRDASEREIVLVRGELRRQLQRDFRSGHEQFSWGAVWSVFDEKSYQASSGLHYAI